MRGGGNEELSLSSPHIAPASHFACYSLSFPAPCSRSPFACHSHVASLDISLKWRACSQAVTVFIVVRDGCIVIIMDRSIPSVPFFQKHLSSAGISFSSQHLSKSGQTVVCSQTRQFPSLLGDLSPIIGRNRSVSR